MSDYLISSGNLFQDLEMPNAAEKMAKVELALKISEFIESQQLTISKVALLLDITLEQVESLQNGRLRQFSLNTLKSYLALLKTEKQPVSRDRTVETVLIKE